MVVGLQRQGAIWSLLGSSGGKYSEKAGALNPVLPVSGLRHTQPRSSGPKAHSGRFANSLALKQCEALILRLRPRGTKTRCLHGTNQPLAEPQAERQ